ncbi:MAG: chemotaxis protein CheW, partial [Elainellaceae cyanobacterium]
MPNSSSESASSVAVSTRLSKQPKAGIQPSESQLLQIVLADKVMLLPVAYLVEILTVPIGQIVPVFNLPPWIPGVYNWRGDILWTVDLGHLLGLSPWYQQTEYGAKHTIVVLDRPHSKQLRSEERSPLGLIVNG